MSPPVTSTQPAAVILAHADPPQVRRVIGSLAGFSVFLHCDRRTTDEVFRAMTDGVTTPVEIVPRLRTTLFSWSLVHAELRGLRAALERSSAEHIVIMSGSCYPLHSPGALHEALAAAGGRTRMESEPLPYAGWSTARNPDGGYWRFRRRFVVVGDQAILVRGIPLRTFRREIPPELSLHGGGQWKIYSRAHAKRLLEVCRERPDLIEFFRTSHVPEESFVPTILQSRELVGSVAEEIIPHGGWYIDWPTDDPTHPRWLTSGSFDAIRAARDAPQLDDRALFARKIRSQDAELVDRIDEELRQ
jgi:hypothetical protein